MNRASRIYVAGHTGLVGSGITRRLLDGGFENLILSTRSETDLTEPAAVEHLFAQEKPEYVFYAAARVGGILANSTFPGDFIRDNLLIQLNVLDAARRHGVKKLLFLGSSCIYPKDAPQPIREEHLLSGPLEPTNRAYAVAKIAGLEMCRAYWQQFDCRFISAMPTNLYGPRDNFDLESSHVLPALMRKIHAAKLADASSVEIWGSGKPRREFLHVDDLADACLFLMERWDSPELVNVGVGRDISIGELAALIAEVVGFTGDITCDETKPDGMPRKLLDVTRLTEAGWTARIGLREGITSTYRWFIEHQDQLRTSS